MEESTELGRPTQVLLCIVSEGTKYCPNIVSKDGKCLLHNQLEEKKIFSKKLEEAEQLIIKRDQQRIKNIIQTNPQIYKVNSSELTALNQPNWIWNEYMNYYGQFDEDGNLVICCQCSACKRENFECLTEKQKENVHCIDCQCRHCVCEARNKAGRVPHNYPVPAYWDNACRGSCESCRQKIEDSETCIII